MKYMSLTCRLKGNKAIIVAGELQFRQLQKSSLKKFWPQQDLNLCLPDTSWVLLPTELLIKLHVGSYAYRARQWG